MIGNNRLAIGMSLHLEDRFSRNAQKIRTEMKALYGDAEGLIQRNQKALIGMSNGALATGAALTYFSYQGVKALADYDKTMSVLKASIGSDMDIPFEKLEERIQSIAISGRYSLEEVGKGAVTLAKAGYQAKQIYEMLGSASDLGTAADIGIDQAADSLGRVLNLYDMAASSSEWVGDRIALAANKSQASVLDLMESFKYAGDVLTDSKVPFEVALSLFARLSTAGLRGSIAGTSVGNMLRYLNKATTTFATGKQKEALMLLGLDRKDLLTDVGTMKPLVGDGGILDILGRRLRAIDPNTAATVTEILTGVRGKRGLSPLLAITENVRSIEDLYKLITEAPRGTAKSFAEEHMNNLWGDLEKLRENWTVFMIELAYNKGLRKLVQFFTSMVDNATKFIKTPIGSFLGGILFYSGPLLLMFGAMNRGLMGLSNMLKNTQEGLWGLSRTMRLVRAEAGENFFGNFFGGQGKSLAYQNIRFNSKGKPYMGPGGGTFGGRTYRAGSPLISSHAALALQYQAQTQNAQWAINNTGRFSGALGRVGNLASKAFTGLTLLGAALGPIAALSNQKWSEGLIGLLGGVLGFFAGGPMGVLVGSSLGMGVGSFFGGDDGDNKAFYDYPGNSQGSIRMGPNNQLVVIKDSANPTYNPNFQNNINLNIDGYNTYQSRYEGENVSDVYAIMGGGY